MGIEAPLNGIPDEGMVAVEVAKGAVEPARVAVIAVEIAGAEAQLEEPHRDGGGPRNGRAVARRGELRALAGRHGEPRLGGTRQRFTPAREARVEQDGGALPGLGGQQQSPRRREAVVLGAPEFRQHGRSSQFQGLFDGPKGRARILGADQDQPVRIDPMGREAGPIGRSRLGGRAILDDPDQGVRAGAASRDREGEAGRRGIVPFVMSHDLVQRTAPQSAGQKVVERQGSVAEPDGWKPGRGIEPALSNRTRTIPNRPASIRATASRSPVMSGKD